MSSFPTPTTQFIDQRPEAQPSRILSPEQLTHFEIESIRDEQRRLNYFTDKTNEELNQVPEQELFINLSLVSLFRNLSRTIIAIINELLEINEQTQFNDIVLIFVKGDRLIYLGMLLIMIALAVFIIQITQ